MKRIVDLVVLLLSAPVWLVVMGFIFIFVRFGMGRPVFFTQERSGRDRKSFDLVKFRTMTDERDGDGKILSDHERLTQFGKWLRSSSLDELPELFNILKGEMTLVGPRPLLPHYNELYNKRQRKRLNVVPGLTGWAQINGRNAISWEKRLELDIWYVENTNLYLDIRIMLLTVLKVLRRADIDASSEMTMEEFQGSKKSGKKF